MAAVIFLLLNAITADERYQGSVVLIQLHTFKNYLKLGNIQIKLSVECVTSIIQGC